MGRELLERGLAPAPVRDRSMLHLARFDDSSVALCGRPIRVTGEDPSTVECVVCAEIDRAFPDSDPARGDLSDEMAQEDR